MEKYGDVVIYYTDPGREHSDNPRFLADCERWFGRKITTLKSTDYRDAMHVCETVRYLSSPQGAPCTGMMKKIPAGRVWEMGDVEIFGYTADETDRLELWQAENDERHIEKELGYAINRVTRNGVKIHVPLYELPAGDPTGPDPKISCGLFCVSEADSISPQNDQPTRGRN